METLGHSSSKPEEESSVETLMFEDDAENIDGNYHVRNFDTCGENRNNLNQFIQVSGSTSWTLALSG